MGHRKSARILPPFGRRLPRETPPFPRPTCSPCPGFRPPVVLVPMVSEKLAARPGPSVRLQHPPRHRPAVHLSLIDTIISSGTSRHLPVRPSSSPHLPEDGWLSRHLSGHRVTRGRVTSLTPAERRRCSRHPPGRRCPPLSPPYLVVYAALSSQAVRPSAGPNMPKHGACVTAITPSFGHNRPTRDFTPLPIIPPAGPVLHHTQAETGC